MTKKKSDQVLKRDLQYKKKLNFFKILVNLKTNKFYVINQI
jgi:hypothetical protein